MEKILYPAVFHKEGERYWVEFPDLEGCFSEGETLEEAYLMAQDALYCYLQECDGGYPKDTSFSDIKVSNNGDCVLLVSPSPYFSKEASAYIIKEAIENGLKERHLNQKQAADILGIDRSYITYIMKGKKIPSHDIASRIALLCGFDQNIFYDTKQNLGELYEETININGLDYNLSNITFWAEPVNKKSLCMQEV